MNDFSEEDRIGAFRALLRRFARNSTDASNHCIHQFLQARAERAFVGSTIDRSAVIDRVAREMVRKEDLLLTQFKNRSLQFHRRLR